jgi:ABC-type multidrug transport system fused ATPase/permease subunit
MIQNLVSNQFLVQGGTEIEITLRPSTIAQMNWSIVIEKGSSVKRSAHTFVLENILFAGVLIQKSVDFIDVEAIA